MATPWDLVTQETPPDSVEVWALAAVPPGPYSLDIVTAAREALLAPGQPIWDAVIFPVPGVMAVRTARVYFGPVGSGMPGANVAGLAVVDTAGGGLLAVSPCEEGPYELGAAPDELNLVVTLSVWKGGE